jgi:glyoxalase family protein
MSNPVAGIHHITAMAGDPRANVAFYTRVLGQRLVKRTVNFDDPGTHHFYYGDALGTPGTILTFFPWPGARRGAQGSGEAVATAYAVPPGALPFWQERLARAGVAAEPVQERFGARVLPLRDPDGMVVELVEAAEPAGAVAHWQGGPVEAGAALRGFQGVTLQVADGGATGALLEQLFGFQRAGQEANRIRYALPGSAAEGAPGRTVDLLVTPGVPRGRLGPGSIHHVAFRVADDAEQAERRTALLRAGLAVTPVQDRQYFRSIYFREPGGVLFELATDGPGFAWDEPVAELGSALRLPPWLEPRRAEIEAALPEIGAQANA